ncbi:MAG: AraC family transcriptional regulator [Clostridiales bacterium]|nr:AraC family transcriptional regulator [Roseburia sp.]MDD7635796.1 AraC family transcriptional regulator [Clostridiales bacterium]MDY4112127.1 AraC family transcriptional regulator [Roseburia sp.]
MPVIIESGLHDSVMRHPRYEIHHSRDNYDDYRPFPTKMEPVALHHHQFYEVFYFISGNITYFVENRAYHLNPGDLLLISPLELHQPMFVPAFGFYERIVLWLEESLISDLSTAGISLFDCFYRGHSKKSNLIHIPKQMQTSMQTLLDNLCVEMQSPTALSPLMERALITQILCQLNRYATDTPKTDASFSRMPAPVAAVIDYINENLGDDLSLETLAAQCYFSKQHLLRTFRSAMGLSVHQYIQKKRLLTATQYIQNGCSPKEAAILCGFSDYSVFYRAFKKEYGFPPSKLAKQP